MKYIKKFENSIHNYSIDDYVLINPDYFKDKSPKIGKIYRQYPYANSYDVTLSNGMILWIDNSMIIKKLTTEEVERYKFEEDIQKYNL